MTDLITILPTDISVRSVLIYEESPVLRHWLARLLVDAATVQDVAAVDNGPALVAAYSARPANLVLIGVHRGSVGGAGAIDLLLDHAPTAAVVVFGSVGDACLLAAAVACGARGLMLLEADKGLPYAAAGRVQRRRLDAGPRPPGRDDAAHQRPTDRQLLILRGMSRGESNKEIGVELFISEDTVKTQSCALYRTLGARDRAHAVALGLRRGLLN